MKQVDFVDTLVIKAFLFNCMKKKQSFGVMRRAKSAANNMFQAKNINEQA